MKKINLVTSIASCLFMGQALAIQPVYEGEDGIKAKVFETNCNMCHSSGLTGASRNGAPDEDNYDTFADAKAHGGDAVEEAVVKMDMPPVASDAPQLTDEQKLALKNWQALGFPEKELPVIYSPDTTELSLPQVYLKDENGEMSLKWKAGMKLIPGSDPLKFEVTEVEEIDASK